MITIASVRNGTTGKQWPGYDLIEESEKVRETHGGEDPDRDDKVLVGVRTGGLTCHGGCHQGFVFRALLRED